MNEDEFNKELTEHFRGSKALVKDRLRFYEPFIAPFRDINARPSAIDLGCGRGEWLALLAENGFEALGVDTNPCILMEAEDSGALLKCADALEALLEIPPDSCQIISAFHLIEHLPFSKVKAVVNEALRILVPGGLLILETPNPENISVISNNFYRDPTHRRPLPRELLSFLVSRAGFSRHTSFLLQEDKKLLEGRPLSIIDVLEGVSPDLAVVSQKNASPEILGRFDPPFSMKSGLSLEQVAKLYDAWLDEKFKRLELLEEQLILSRNELHGSREKIESLTRENGRLEIRLGNEKSVLENLRAELIDSLQRNEKLESHAQSLKDDYRESVRKKEELAGKKEYWRLEAQKYRQLYEATILSRCWRITAPVRMVSRMLRSLVKPGQPPTASPPAENQFQAPDRKPLTGSEQQVFQELNLAVKRKDGNSGNEDSN